MLRRYLIGASLLAVAACGQEPDGILIELAPDVVSSEDGTIHVRALVVDDRSPLDGEFVQLTATYTDRNGTDHAIESSMGKSDQRGAYEAVLTGFDWDGAGTITATVVTESGQAIMGGGEPIVGTATFAVLDRTPPTLTILPPTQDLKVGPGFPIDIQVMADDEIGISEIILEAVGDLDKSKRTVVASGTMSTTATFNFDIPNDARTGPTITLYALAIDMSGNIAAAAPVVLEVDPSISIAVAPGLSGSMVTGGDQNFLEDPQAIAVSAMDGMLYVADNSGNGTCNGACIRKVDPSTGAVDAGVVVNGLDNEITGVAFDATGDNLYYSDFQGRVRRMTWNAGNSAYENAVDCVQTDDVQDPWHLVFDSTRGILVVDRNNDEVMDIATCNSNNNANTFTSNNLNGTAWGIALAPNGDIYVSDEGDDEVWLIDDNGDRTMFEDRDLDKPKGLEWIDGGPSAFADSLLIANNGSGRVSSSRGRDTARTAVFLRNDPVDLAVANGTLYILTEPSANNRGRIFSVTGF